MNLTERMRKDLIDSYDEELELELDDRELDPDTLLPHPGRSEEEKEARRLYFRELFRMQAELVKLQDWVVDTGHKVVILFEGRDAAGKGGVIKRIVQRLNPRVCRVAALPAPSDRERTQWYFQRYVAHLPAAGEIVFFDRSWYNRVGVERVMGFCTNEEYEEFFQSVPEFERMLVRSGIQLIKYWFSISGGIHPGQGDHAGAHPHSGSPVVGGPGHRQEKGSPELHQPSPAADSLRRSRAADHPDAGARVSRRLCAPGPAGGYAGA
jgi:polyphosphate kinase 2 (PPK2 family)